LLFVVSASISVAVGTVLALTPPSPNLSKDDQYGFAAELFTLGGLGVMSGVRSLFIEDPIEAGWEGYESGKSHSTSTVRLSGLGFVPTPGGGIVGLGATF
jgi:hypothetical protein